jgi:hypothetical protein
MPFQTRTGDNRGENKEKVREDKLSNFSYLFFCLVGHPRYFSNFTDLEILCERLEQLDIEIITDDGDV